MAAIFRKDPDSLGFTAWTDLTAGDIVKVAGFTGVVINDAKTGRPVSVRVSGIFEVAKNTGAIVSGTNLFWDSANGYVTTTANEYYLGRAVYDATTDASVVFVRLQPGNATVKLAAPTANLTSSASSITATFTAIPCAQSYKMRYGTSDTLTGDGTDYTSATAVTGLTASTKYYVQVKTIGDEINFVSSDWTTIAEVTTSAGV